MKYLQTRNNFLNIKQVELNSNEKVELFRKSQMIRETFENDITWGGSIIGRLINTVLRMGKIMINSQRIKSLVPLVERELNNLLENAIFTGDDSKKIIVLKFQMLFEEIVKVVKSDSSISIKITQLAGNEKGEGGLIENTITEIEKIEDLEGKDDIIKKLKDFKEALLKMREDQNLKPEEGDEEGEEGEGQGQGENDEETDKKEDGDLNSTMSEFFKSIIDLFKFFKKAPEPPKKKTKLTWKGKEVVIVSKGEKKVGPGGDETWNTEDDVFGKPPEKIVPPDSVQIIVKNPITNKFDKDSEVVIVKPNELKKESLLVENVSPEIAKQIQAVKTKIGNAFKNSEMIKYESLFVKLQSDIQSNQEESLEYGKEIMKQVFKNEITEGKPITFQELIKESAVPYFKTEYRVLPKVISLVARVVMSLKDNMEFLDNLGDSKDPIKSFIENYEKLKNSIQKDKEVESKSQVEGGTETGEANKDQSGGESKGGTEVSASAESEDNKFKRYNYRILKGETDNVKNKFWELEEELFNAKLKKGENTKTGEGTRDRLLKKAKDIVKENLSFGVSHYSDFISLLILEDVAGEMDAIYQEWRKHFSEEDEKRYIVDQKTAKELQQKGDQAEKSKIKIDFSNPKQYDSIVEIVRLFGRAWRMYSTPYIPSGRPGGRVSISTMNEYEYLGKESPRFSEESNPGYGPWAAKKTLRNWQDGIMNLLKKPEYRKILANSEFVNTGPNQVEDAGRDLFRFMNDMISGVKGTFEELSNNVLEKYFTGEQSEKLKKDFGSPVGDPKPINPKDKGDKGALSFMILKENFTESDFKISENYLKTFGLVEGKMNGKSTKMIIYFDSLVKMKKTYLIMKFHMGIETKQTLISSYLKNEIASKGLKLDENLKYSEGKEIYIGIYEYTGTNSKIFRKGSKTNIKFQIAKDIFSKQAVDLEIVPNKDLCILGYLDENKEGVQTQKVIKREGKIEKIPTGDVVNMSEKIRDPKVINNFGLEK